MILAGAVGVQYAVNISSADWRNLSMGFATKYPHLNEHRASSYGGLQNARLRNKDLKDKSTT